MKVSLVFLLALASCLASAQRSRDVLGSALSQAELRTPPRETSREIVRLFATRGFALIDQRSSVGGLVLRFKGNRESISRGGESPSIQFGSTFSVSIVPAPGDHAVVSIDGAPTVDGHEPCAPDGMEPCGTAPLELALSGHINGRAEADVVHGVFSELALEGLVVAPGARSPESARAQALAATNKCEATRHRMLVEAYQTEHKLERTRLIQSAPSCL